MTSFTLRSDAVAGLLGSVLPGASKDKTFPMLCAVHVTFDGGTVTATTTDRFVAVQSSIQADLMDGSGSMLIPAADVKRILSTFKQPARTAPTDVTFEVPDITPAARITVRDNLGQLMTVADYSSDGQFPRVSQLFTNALASYVGTDSHAGTVGLAPGHFAQILAVAKVACERNAPFRVHAPAEPNKAVLVSFSQYDSPLRTVAMIMPVRLSEGDGLDELLTFYGVARPAATEAA